MRPVREVDREAEGGEQVSQVIAYSIPYATYRLLMCLRCAKPYPDGPDKKPETVVPLYAVCDKCHVKIKEQNQ